MSFSRIDQHKKEWKNKLNQYIERIQKLDISAFDKQLLDVKTVKLTRKIIAYDHQSIYLYDFINRDLNELEENIHSLEKNYEKKKQEVVKEAAPDTIKPLPPEISPEVKKNFFSSLFCCFDFKKKNHDDHIPFELNNMTGNGYKKFY